MKRLDQAVLIVSFLGFSWLAMQAVHELGHVLGARLSGAEVRRVALHPCIISRTDLGHNPHPLLVVWSGPIVGSVLPLLALLAVKSCRSPGVYLFRFFSGFCLMANGLYIAFGPSQGGADAGVMMLHGSARWVMVLFGLLTSPLWLWLLHRQGPCFGFGDAQGKVDRRTAIISVLLLLGIAGAEVVVNSK